LIVLKWPRNAGPFSFSQNLQAHYGEIHLTGNFNIFALSSLSVGCCQSKIMNQLHGKFLKGVILLTACSSALLTGSACLGQTAEESFHPAGSKPAWNGTGGVCNVCHEPFQAHYANRQPAPYQNHQITASTFTGSKLDGAPVQIRTDKVSQKCQSCHEPTPNRNLPPIQDTRDFFEIHRR
jgi:hypothetical protein